MAKTVLPNVVEITKYNLNQYLNGNPEPWFDSFAGNAVLIATGEEMLFGVENIKAELRKYGELGQGKLCKEEYFSIPINNKSSVVVAKTITIPANADDNVRVSTVYSFVYQLIGQEPKVIFQHDSYEYFKAEVKSENKNILPMDASTYQFVKHLLMDHSSRHKLCVVENGQNIYVDTNMLLYIQNRGHSTELHCIDKVISTNKKLRDFLEELPEEFFQIHRGYIINTKHLLSVRCYEAELVSGVKIPIPSANYGKVKAALEELAGKPLRKKKK